LIYIESDAGKVVFRGRAIEF